MEDKKKMIKDNDTNVMKVSEKYMRENKKIIEENKKNIQGKENEIHSLNE